MFAFLGAMARAASQGTIHPLDTMKVRMQTVGRISKPQGKSHLQASAPRLLHHVVLPNVILSADCTEYI